MDNSSAPETSSDQHPLASAERGKSEPISVALIGVGGFGRVHVQCLEKMQREGRVRLTAVADPSPALVEERRQLEAQGVRWYAGYEEMLAAEKNLQAVQIASPVPFHYEMTKACLERGLFIRLEKPPVVLIQDLEDLIARDSQERVSVGFQHIDSIQIQTLKRWIVEGRLGRIRAIRVGACWPRRARYYARAWAGKMSFMGRPVFDGPATNALAHLIHNIMFLAGPDLAGFAVPTWIKGEFYRVRPIESYDLVALQGEIGDGTTFIASLTHATEQMLPYQIEVRGDRDWARLSEEGLRLETSDGVHAFSARQMEEDAHLKAQENFLDFASGAMRRPSTRLCDTRGFVRAIDGGILSSGVIHPVPARFVRTYGQDGESGVDVDGLVSLIERSRESGKLFHELGAPWAHSSQKIPVENLRHLDLPQIA